MVLKQQQAGSRREFFRAAARYTVLGLLAVASLVVGRRSFREGQRCVNRGLCSGCGLWENCSLPQALSAKQHKGVSS